MNHRGVATVSLVGLLASGCLHVETGRQVVVDLALQEIAIIKRERVLALLTVDGPLPKTNETAYVISQQELTGRGRMRLTIPDNAQARYGALVSGRIDLDFDRKLAVVKVRPADRYRWLDLDGEYPIVYDGLWKGRPIRRDARYPAHWWTPVPAEGAPAWEILPQAAGPGEVILSKRHELGLLSNFAPTPFTYRGVRYASLEGFWQMMKYPEDAEDPRAKHPGLKWEFTRDQVAQLTAFEAKRAGDLASANMKQMGIGWVSFEGRRFDYRPAAPGEHCRLIVAATEEKVRQNPEVQKVLLATGDLKLMPDHHQEPGAPAAWRYFEILTAIRSRMQQSPQPDRTTP